MESRAEVDPEFGREGSLGDQLVLNLRGKWSNKAFHFKRGQKYCAAHKVAYKLFLTSK